jgi:[protein-PII] uridylyltransferase
MSALDDAGPEAGPSERAARLAAAAGEPPVVLAGLVADLMPAGRPVPREEAVTLLRRHLGRVQNRVQQAFEAHELSGLAAARWLAALTDTVMVGIHAYTEATLPPAPGEKPWALVATGGYGRGVLAPFSDIDLLFLTDAGMGARGKQSVEFMLYLLWDLGLKVGHATRSRADCLVDAKGDATVLTALLDARHVAGDEAVFRRFEDAFRKTRADWGLRPFLAAKRAERQQRHARYGESPFMVEPHVKEGRGGLRDLQTLYWLARYAFNVQRMPELVGPASPGGGLLLAEEARAIRRAWDFFWTVRFHLHAPRSA